MIGLKERLKEDVMWVLGSGQTVKAIGEPWFQGWENARIGDAADGHLLVADLINMQIFEAEIQSAVMQTIPPPIQNTRVRDRLIWQHSKSESIQFEWGIRY
jgi:hypothetical protein